MKVLLIDDEQPIIDFYCHAAKSRGYADIDTVTSAEEALTQVLRQDYSLIILDINMPGASGLEIVSMLRNLCPHAVIAVISGHIPKEVPGEVAECTDVMISKPIHTDTFGQLLEWAAEISEVLDKIHHLEKGNVAVE